MPIIKIVRDEMRWFDDAYCAKNNIPTNTFFEKFEKGTKRAKDKTVAMCNTLCPVKDQCFQYGMETRSSGLFGGEYLEKGHPIKGGSLVRGYLEDSRDEIARSKVAV